MKFFNQHNVSPWNLSIKMRNIYILKSDLQPNYKMNIKLCTKTAYVYITWSCEMFTRSICFFVFFALCCLIVFLLNLIYICHSIGSKDFLKVFFKSVQTPNNQETETCVYCISQLLTEQNLVYYDNFCPGFAGFFIKFFNKPHKIPVSMSNRRISMFQRKP